MKCRKCHAEIPDGSKFCLKWGVKSGCDAAIARARAAGADILLFGHTHQPLCQQMEDGLWVLNPGPSRSSYGTILLEEGLTCCTLTRLL